MYTCMFPCFRPCSHLGVVRHSRFWVFARGPFYERIVENPLCPERMIDQASGQLSQARTVFVIHNSRLRDGKEPSIR